MNDFLIRGHSEAQIVEKSNPCKQETVKKIRREKSISKNQAIP